MNMMYMVCFRMRHMCGTSVRWCEATALINCPDSDGRLFSERVHDLPIEMLQDPEGEVEVAQNLRSQA